MVVAPRTEQDASDCVAIPGVPEPLSLSLPPGIAALRRKALELHRGPQDGIVELTFADARAWATHSEDEDWLIWRGRRTAERLRAMPVGLEPGELLVGKPLFRTPTPEEGAGLQEASEILASMPPFPGGDAGHFHPDWEKLLQVGIGGILDEITARASAPDLPAEQQAFYEACRIAMEGLSVFAQRVGQACEDMASQDAADAVRWRDLAAICRRVAVEPPATFHEAMQLMFMGLIALWFAEDHGLTCPGRMDQTLRRFYEADIATDRITRQGAFDLICCLYIQLNRILWPGSAVAVMVGGRDKQVQDVTNELTYLCLAARQATQLVYPTLGVAWHEGTPDELMNFCTRMVATGIGDPAFFNDEVIPLGLREHGVSVPDSFNYMNSTCVEIKVVGASHVWVTAPYFNLPQALLDVMGQATQPEASLPATFAELQGRVRRNLAKTIRGAAEGLHRTWEERGRTGCFPLASCLISDCLERGLDFDRGGARYNWVENSFVGLANLVDSLIAVKHLVYEEGDLSLDEFSRILQADFEGHEALRQRIANTLPRYGNDDAEADTTATKWTKFLVETTESNTVGVHRYVPGFFCWIIHEMFGSQTGATPDGRRAGWALADGAGAAQGREKCGPTASVLSTTSWSHRKVLGGLVHNAKFPKSLLRADSDLEALRAVIETYLRRGGFEMQVNVVGKETLLEAQEHPERYLDLLVRVAGYSDYFVHLNRNMQDEVIARTEHGL